MMLISWLRRKNLRLPHGHFLRNGLARTFKVLDPLVADVLWAVFALSVLFFFGIGILQERPAWFFVGLGAASLAIVCFYTAQSLRWILESLADLLNCAPQALSGYGHSELAAMARHKLEKLANELVLIEYKTDPYMEERAEAKRRFEDAYRFFLEHHLIEDVGYDRFFKSKP